MLVKLALVTLPLVVLAMCLYTPLPASVEDQFKMQLYFAKYKIVAFVAHVGAGLGFGSFLEILKKEIPSPQSSSLDGVKVSEERMAGVPVLVYRPDSVVSQLSPATVYMHGGGWMILEAKHFDLNCLHLSKQTNSIVISVDYRCGPEFTFPVPVQDCLDVTRYVLQHGGNHGVDVMKVGVAGDSAGGNMAAAVANTLSQERSDLPQLIFQVLHVPLVQAVNLRLPSHMDNDYPMLSKYMMSSMLAVYLGLDQENIDHYVQVLTENRHVPPDFLTSKYAQYVDVKNLPHYFQRPNKTVTPVHLPYDEAVFNRIGDVITNPLLSPLLAHDLRKVPPAFIHTAEMDILRDDAFLYAHRLQEVGVKVDFYFSVAGFHSEMQESGPQYFQFPGGQSILQRSYAFINDVISGA